MAQWKNGLIELLLYSIMLPATAASTAAATVEQEIAPEKSERKWFVSNLIALKAVSEQKKRWLKQTLGKWTISKNVPTNSPYRFIQFW